MAVLHFKPIRGNTAKVNAYKGEAGELVIDTTTYQVCVQDGVTFGGVRMAKDVDATQQMHGLMSAADKQRLDVMYSQMASLVTQIEDLSDKLNTLLTQVDSYYAGYDDYPRS